jgi:cell division inhibitor SepF
MASAMRKMAVYLGLVEDDHRYDDPYQDEYGADDYEEYGADLAEHSESRDVHLTYGEGGARAPFHAAADHRSRPDHHIASAHVQ